MINRIICIFKLIRIYNLIILFTTHYFIYYFIIKNQVDLIFFLLTTSTILIAASGYIINDIIDVKSDMINRKNNIIIGKHITEKSAIYIYYIFILFSLIFTSLILIKIENYFLFLIMISSILVLRIYSSLLKHRFILGNITVSILISLSVINSIFISDLTYEDAKIYIILLYAFLAFLVNLSREIIKDLEDIKGDIYAGSMSLAILLNLRKVKIINFIILFILFFTISLLSWNLISFESIIDIIYSLFMILVLLNILFIKYRLYKSKNKNDFKILSNLLKLLMVQGLLSIPLIFY